MHNYNRIFYHFLGNFSIIWGAPALWHTPVAVRLFRGSVPHDRFAPFQSLAHLHSLLYANKISEFGFHAFVFDFPGSGAGKSMGRTSLEMTVLTEKEDLSTVLDYVKNQPFVDSNHIFLMGCSQGGFVSALLAAERENEIEKLILNYPALCICDDCRKGYRRIFEIIFFSSTALSSVSFDGVSFFV